jgi:hypothetical protein
MGTEAFEQEKAEPFRVAVAKFGGPMARQEEGKEADLFAFIGKDETERIFLVPKRRMSSDEFAARVASVMGRMTTSYSTVRVLAKGVVGSDLEREIRELRKELEKAVVIGVSQVLLAPPPEQKTYELDLVTRDRLAYALATTRKRRSGWCWASSPYPMRTRITSSIFSSPKPGAGTTSPWGSGPSRVPC